MLDEQKDADLELLRSDLSRLRADLGRLGASASAIARARFRQARAAASCEAREELEEAARKVNARIDAYPAAALLLAFGLGIVLRSLIGRR